MALELLETNIVLDVYDHDGTRPSIKSIALDDNTRYVFARLTYQGNTYDIGSTASVNLIIIRPDKVGAQIAGEAKEIRMGQADESIVSVYGAYAELDQPAIAVAGTLLGQFVITSGDQILRSQIFAVNNGQALDADTWAGDYDGYNLDELVEKVDAAVEKVDGMEADVSELKSGLTQMTTATASDVGKALKAKTVTDGKVTEWEFGEAGGADPEGIEQAVTNWLDKHPEATTTVKDGSITSAKLTSNLQSKVNNINAYSVELDKWSIPNDGTDAVNTTANINSMLAWASAQGFSAVIMPSGTYLIDAVNHDADKPINQRINCGVQIPSNMAFIMQADTTLKVATNSACAYSCVYLGVNKKNILIKGGKIIGDRDTHDFTGDQSHPSHEYGYGVYTQGGDNIVIDGVFFDGFTGDAIFYGNYGGMASFDTEYYPTVNSKIINCTLQNSRRNNISSQACDNLWICNNVIRYAGSEDSNHDGTSPRLGIDIEGYGEGDRDFTITRRVYIFNNTFEGNIGGALNLQTGYECVVEGNLSDDTISYAAGNNITIANNVFYRTDENTKSAISSLRVANGFDGNYTVITGNSINGFNVGMNLRGAKVLVTSNNIAKCGIGVSVYDATNITVAQNVFDAYTVGAVSVSNGQHIFIDGNKLINGLCETAHIQVGSQSTNEDVNIINNYIAYSIRLALLVRAGTNISVKRNTFVNNGGKGINIYSSVGTVTFEENDCNGAYITCESGTPTENSTLIIRRNTFRLASTAVSLSKAILTLIEGNTFINTKVGSNNDGLKISASPQENISNQRRIINNLFYTITAYNFRHCIWSENGSNVICGNRLYGGDILNHADDVNADNFVLSVA